MRRLWQTCTLCERARQNAGFFFEFLGGFEQKQGAVHVAHLEALGQTNADVTGGEQARDMLMNIIATPPPPSPPIPPPAAHART